MNPSAPAAGRSAASLMDATSLASHVHLRLRKVYGIPAWRQPLSPLDELVSTILSQNTNDHNRDIAFTNLKAAFVTWEAARDAPVEAVIAAIRTAGLANQKGPRIQGVLQEITRQRGRLELDFLRTLPQEQARAWLMAFPGVGPKTAAIVLQFALGKPAFPVDTHIYRVSGRLGLRPIRMTVENTHHHLAGLFPPEDYGEVHLNFIRLGREVCHARKPDCKNCPVNYLCRYEMKTTGG